MYIPPLFRFDNVNDQVAFMKKYSFATIITNKENTPIATQLPFVITEDAGRITLTSHFAAVNEQAKYIEDNISLVIFTEPHAYISPIHYDKYESVPTWDYIAVHAYGKAKILTHEDQKMKVIEEMITFYEEDYKKQWNDLPSKYKNGMLKGIVAFEIEITHLQAQQKLSQNKNKEEISRIVKQLENSKSSVEKDLAEYILKAKES